MAFAFVSDNTEGGLVNTLFPVILITVPYAINAAYWFLFYRWYPQDAARAQAQAHRAAVLEA